jgi:hypothetical protein
VPRPLALSRSGAQLLLAEAGGSAPRASALLRATPVGVQSRTPKGQDRPAFDEHRAWAAPDSAESEETPEELMGATPAAVGPSPPAVLVGQLHKQLAVLHLSRAPLAAEEVPRAEEGGRARSGAGAADRLVAWIATVSFDWSAQQGQLVRCTGDWRPVELHRAAADEDGVVRIGGLCAGACYELRCSALDSRGQPGPSALLWLSTLYEETRLPEVIALPDSWRLAIGAPEDASDPRRRSSTSSTGSGKRSELAGGAVSHGGVPGGVVQRRGALDQSACRAIAALATKYRQWLICAFRHGCYLVNQEADEGSRQLLETERARTRMRKQYDLRFRRLVLILAPGPNIEAVKAILVAARLHIEGAAEIAAVICNGGGTLEVATSRAALARAILNSQRLYEVPVGIGVPSGKPYHAQPHEYTYPGFGRVDQSKLRSGRDVLAEVLASAAPKSLTFVLLSALSDVAEIIRSTELETELYAPRRKGV